MRDVFLFVKEEQDDIEYSYMKSRISIMAAITDERGLGKDNDLLVKIPEDFVRMKALTMGHPIVMGRKRYESIGRPLPGRTNIVVTRDSAYAVAGVTIAHSLENALEVAKKSSGFDEIFIFGGSQIFQQAIGIVDRLYLTVIHKNFPADVFFPEYSNFTKVLEKKDEIFENVPYTFLTLEKE